VVNQTPEFVSLVYNYFRQILKIMYIKPSRILPIFLRYGVAIFLLLTIIGLMLSLNFVTITDPYSWDEHLYQNVSNNFTIEHIKYLEYNMMESKPLTFLVLQYSLDKANPTYTRLFNLLLIFVCTYLIFKLTDNKWAFLYILIPIALDSMWLTAEIIEITFVLLSIRYANKSGIFIGLATIFRPSAIVYSLLIKRKQIWSVLIIGTFFAGILLYLGLFFSYWYEVTNYLGTRYLGLDMYILLVTIMFIIIGLNKKMLGYVLVSAIALNIQMYPHYFLPINTFLFVGFLLNMNDDIKEINK